MKKNIAIAVCLMTLGAITGYIFSSTQYTVEYVDVKIEKEKVPKRDIASSIKKSASGNNQMNKKKDYLDTLLDEPRAKELHAQTMKYFKDFDIDV